MIYDGGGEFSLMLPEIDEISLSGSSMRSIVNVAPKLYAHYRRGIRQPEDICH